MEIFDKLFYYSITFYHSPKPDYQRAILKQIDFSQKMITLIGAKGVGKTTLLHQYMAGLNLGLKIQIPRTHHIRRTNTIPQ